MPLHLFIIISILFIVTNRNLVAAEAENETHQSDVYEVISAKLNDKNCEVDGKPTYYASKYFKVGAMDKSGVDVTICNGESADDIECLGGYAATHLDQASNQGWLGYNFNARLGVAKDGSPRCSLHALRRKVIPMKGDYVRYERTDWSETLSDFIAECHSEMAEMYSQSNSLKCSTHIVVVGRRIVSTEKSYP